MVTNYRIGYLPTARTVNYGGDFQRMYAPYGYADVDPQATQANIQKSAGRASTRPSQQAKQTLVAARHRQRDGAEEAEREVRAEVLITRCRSIHAAARSLHATTVLGCLE